MLGCIVRTDWEGDQFTYAKPRQSDLERLYGIEIHEMLPYRPMPDHIQEQLSLGRTVLVEMDAWYLPDTAATSYRREHLKTTVAPLLIDPEHERMRYLHNAGCFELEGEDYQGVFRELSHFTDDVMEPFCELVSFDAGPRLAGEQLRDAARELLTEHWQRRPANNPFAAWGKRMVEDLPRLLAGDAADYHAYAFVTVRMVGSAFELLADHAEWLYGEGGRDASRVLREIVEATKVLSFRLARRRQFDAQPILDAMARSWEDGMQRLGRLL